MDGTVQKSYLERHSDPLAEQGDVQGGPVL